MVSGKLELAVQLGDSRQEGAYTVGSHHCTGAEVYHIELPLQLHLFESARGYFNQSLTTDELGVVHETGAEAKACLTVGNAIDDITVEDAVIPVEG